MKIKPNASPDEYNSPYFKRNEKFCAAFESYIAAKEGEVKGSYNAWSYTIFGKIRKPKSWTLKYKKATYSSGNIWLSSKRQNLQALAEWTTNWIGNNTVDFTIRKKIKTDFLRLAISNDWKPLETSKKYIITSKGELPYFLTDLIKALEKLINSEELYQVELNNTILKIELRTDKHHFDIFDKLLNLL
ncbi:MAG TPA: hypothetical protein ENK46_02595 [Flavobacteriia bacterium]|nr:hypothetical protein [Flavobacteriia bacterium]